MTNGRPKSFPLGLADVVRADGSAHGSRVGHPKASPARPGSEHPKRPGSAAAAAQGSVKPAAVPNRPVQHKAVQPKPAGASVPSSGGAHKPGPLKPAYARAATAKTNLKHPAKPAGQGLPPPALKPAGGAKPAPRRHVDQPANTVNPLAKTHREAPRAIVPSGVLNSDRVRERMVERLRAGGIRDARVLAALAAVPRHQFVDAGLATQAYEDAALPIGHHQTISKPSVVARMIELAAVGRPLNKVLEIGTGCGYQAAVLSQVAREVYSIERIKPLFERAKSNLRPLRVPNIRLHYGDGRVGLPAVAPFDAILLAAAGLEVPQALLEQLAIGGRLIAPVGGEEQVLTLIERLAPTQWRESRLDRVFFVPLKSGVV